MSNNKENGVLRGENEPQRVEPVELFFDLVFVFAIAQLSHTLLHHLTVAGALKTLVLFVAVWWVWIYTTWCTNWLITHHVRVRLMLFALMLLGLWMSTAIPDAYGARGLSFALAYVLMQVGRSVFMLIALAGKDPGNFRNFQRITVWLAVSAPLWILGGLAEPGQRWLFWVFALCIEFVSPMLGFRVPGLGKSTASDWKAHGEHMAERCGLIVIIALGEMIMLAGVTFSGLDWSPAAAVVFAASVISTIAMWWIYFNIGAERAAHLFAKSDNPGSIARIAYTYIHLPILFGIVATAAGIELMLAHPTGQIATSTAIVVLGAPAVFLVGEILFKKVTAGWMPLSHLVGLVAVIALGYASSELEPVALVVAVSALLVTIATWETLSLRNNPYLTR